MLHRKRTNRIMISEILCNYLERDLFLVERTKFIRAVARNALARCAPGCPRLTCEFTCLLDYTNKSLICIVILKLPQPISYSEKSEQILNLTLNYYFSSVVSIFLSNNTVEAIVQKLATMHSDLHLILSQFPKHESFMKSWKYRPSRRENSTIQQRHIQRQFLQVI